MDFKALPKIELHAHLSGSISRECLHEVWLAKKKRGETSLEDPLIQMPPGKFDYDLKTFFPLFSSYIYNLVTDLDALILTTNSVLQDFEADGVVYLELRTTPRAIPSANITKEQYLLTILTCIQSFNASSPTLHTSLILSIDRRNTPEDALSVVTLYHTLSSLTPRLPLCGLDLCGDPAVPLSSSLVSILSSATTSSPPIPLTVHFAESPQSSSDEELWALLKTGAKRLGHVINVSEELRMEVVKRELGVELCLSCNVHAKMITGSFGDHHFGWWWGEGREGRGARIALSTDDVGVFGSTLSNEYALIAEHFKLDRKQICELARGAIDVIFGSEEEKERLGGLMWV